MEGEQLLETLEKVVGRQENVVTPVEGDDIFPILARRLFTAQGAEEERRQRRRSVRRLLRARPWRRDSSDLPRDGFPRPDRRRVPVPPGSRRPPPEPLGVAVGFPANARCAQAARPHGQGPLAFGTRMRPLIHVGDVDLADDGVRGEVLKVAGESYKSALNADIIRPDSKAPEEDRRRGGQAEELRVATGLATSAFLYSFGPDRVLGGSAAQMLAGVARPGLGRGLVDDIRDGLRELLWYARVEGGRFRFTTEPNLNKVILEREGAIDDEQGRGASLRDAREGCARDAGASRRPSRCRVDRLARRVAARSGHPRLRPSHRPARDRRHASSRRERPALPWLSRTGKQELVDARRRGQLQRCRALAARLEHSPLSMT